MKSKTIVLFLFTSLFWGSIANSNTFESLEKSWKNTSEDSNKIRAGLSFYKQFYYKYEDSAVKSIELLTQIFDLSKKLNYDLGMIECSFYLGNCYSILSKPNEAIKFYYISLKSSEKSGNKQGVAKAKMGIGLVYFSQNNFKNAIEFFKGSLIINQKLKDVKRISTQLYLIGISYNNLKNFDKSKSNLDSALSIRKKINDKKGINECMLGIADYFKGKNKYDTALKIYDELLQIFINEKEVIPISLIYSALAEIYLNKNNLNIALDFALKALKYSEKSANYLPKLKATEVAYKVYYQKNDFKNSINNFAKFQALKDSIENKDFIAQISIAHAQYNFEKEQNALKAEQHRLQIEHQIELKDNRRKQDMLFVFLFVLFLIAIIITVAYRGLNIQKKISETLLLNILPKETANELKKFGHTVPKIHKGATIMFCDVKNFSSVAEKLTPEQIVEMLDTYFKQFDNIVQKTGIEKIKTIGDAYMCVAGLQGNSKDAAIKSVNSAIEFLKFNKQIESSMLNKYGYAFYFRIGIHSGNVVSGVVGEMKYSYDIWGDDVNVAARMEQNSLPGFINISESTFELVKDTFQCTSRGNIPVKNKGAVAMYFVNIDEIT